MGDPMTDTAGPKLEVQTEELWAAIRQRDDNINAAFAGLNAIEEQLREMRSLKGWRLNLIRENLEKTKAALRTPTVAQAVPDPLRAAAERVCWFDWSDNDMDACAAMDALRKALTMPSAEGK